MKTVPLWDLIADIVPRSKVLVLLDYDGTVVPIRARPGLALLGANRRETLSLMHGANLQLAMVSGRSVSNLRERVGLDHIGYCGVFGLEAHFPGWSYLHSAAKALRPAVAGLTKTLQDLYKDMPGVLIEDKTAGLTLHYRNVPRKLHPEFSRLLAKAKEMSPPGLHWSRGKAAWEVIPKTSWDKGKTALKIWRRLGRPYLLAIGDDDLDEPMLRVAQARGAGIRVGNSAHTGAGHRLRNSAEVHRFLRALIANRVQGSKR